LKWLLCPFISRFFDLKSPTFDPDHLNAYSWWRFIHEYLSQSFTDMDVSGWFAPGRRLRGEADRSQQ
jgi:hypothetical protein